MWGHDRPSIFDVFWDVGPYPFCLSSATHASQIQIRWSSPLELQRLAREISLPVSFFVVCHAAFKGGEPCVSMRTHFHLPMSNRCKFNIFNARCLSHVPPAPEWLSACRSGKINIVGSGKKELAWSFYSPPTQTLKILLCFPLWPPWWR